MGLSSRALSIGLLVVAMGVASSACHGGFAPIDGDGDQEGDAGSDSDLTDADDGADADLEDAGDADADDGGDADPPPTCPVGMVEILFASLCVDAYEASQGDGGAALSRVGATPWTDLNWTEASQACELAGKRLCTSAEWLQACGGPDGSVYPYGDAYGRDCCNGHDHDLRELTVTGAMACCQGGYPGIFDMSGNAAEWTSTCDSGDCDTRGGSYVHSTTYLQCTAGITSTAAGAEAFRGFRCCRTAGP